MLYEVITISVVASFALIEALRPIINQFFEIDFHVFYSDPTVIISIVAVPLICLGLTALFVTLFLFRKRSAIDILSTSSSYAGSFVMKSLLIVQVCIVIMLISSAFLVNKQIDFISEKSLGFDQENVVVLQVKDFSKDPAVFADELRKQSQVLSVGFTSQHFGYPTQSLSYNFV